jgi:two-component system response regulator RegX3
VTARVLIVEDDEQVVTLLEQLLTHEGYEVAAAGDGLAGLLKLGAGGIDAVLLDVMMPDVDGTRVLDQLFEEHGDPLPLPVLVITGSPEAARECRERLGDDDVFLKPFDPTALLGRLRVRLAGEETTE